MDYELCKINELKNYLNCKESYLNSDNSLIVGKLDEKEKYYSSGNCGDISLCSEDLGDYDIFDRPKAVNVSESRSYFSDCVSDIISFRSSINSIDENSTHLLEKEMCKVHLDLPLNQYCITCCEFICNKCAEVHLNNNCRMSNFDAMRYMCIKAYEKLSNSLKNELEKCEKEYKNVEEVDLKVKNWTERARMSLINVKQAFYTHLENFFQNCEKFINKQSKTAEELNDIYSRCISKCQSLQRDIQVDLDNDKNVVKAYHESFEFSRKLEEVVQEKVRLPVLPFFEEQFYLPSYQNIAKSLAELTNFSYCKDVAKPELCHRVNNNDLCFSEYSYIKMKLNYSVSFGSFGVECGQFCEPVGVCVAANGLIAVTDAKNHRIQVFDEFGCFKFVFGISGSNVGEMLYPNCIASCPLTNNFIITERTPIHQIQVYSSSGSFIRRFGRNHIQYPRGITVDNRGNIIVVECKVMRVTIFDQIGNVMYSFCQPSSMSFPMDVCVNDKYEIFVVDNRRHCVHVFDYNGNVLRTICDNGYISFPISVNINGNGELVVTDNHQSFNMAFFTQNGELIRSYESRSRHLQCLSSTVLGLEKVFVTTKDFRVYMYDCCKKM